MKILLLLLKNNLIQLCRLNQLRYADNQKRRNTIYLYIFVGTILIGGLVYLRQHRTNATIRITG